MKSQTQRSVESGSILIYSLWVLIILAFFAAHIGLNIRYKISLLSKLEHRSQLHWSVQSGVKKAIAVLRGDLNQSNGGASSYSKYFRYNNPEVFQGIEVGPARVDVLSTYYNSDGTLGLERFGVVDEDQKININTADKNILRKLILNIGAFDRLQGDAIVNAIIDWKEFGQSDSSGFYSDNYYDNLKDPYLPKKAEFEWLDELLLVEGITQEVFNKIRPYITIYGDGLVNINTASRIVLISLGLEPDLADKVIAVRRGLDGIENTADDYVFNKTFDIAVEMQKFVELNADEIRQVDNLNSANLIKTSSSVFFIHARAKLGNNETKEAEAIYDLSENSIKYWREK